MTDVPALRREWGQRVRDRRHALELTQAQLGQRISSSAQRINQIEHGRGGTSDGFRLRLAAALGTTVGDLFPYPTPEPIADPAQDRGAA